MKDYPKVNFKYEPLSAKNTSLQTMIGQIWDLYYVGRH